MSEHLFHFPTSDSDSTFASARSVLRRATALSGLNQQNGHFVLNNGNLPSFLCQFNCKSFKTFHRLTDKLQLRHYSSIAPQETLFTKRRDVLCSGASLVAILTLSCGFRPLPLLALEKGQNEEEVDGDEGIFDTIKTLFDPNEKTKSGKILPKAYLKSAREVVKTLRESLKEDANDIAKFRKTADAAKESIREYLNGWRGQQSVATEESYVAIEKAIRSLANFYSKAGPFAPLPEDVKSSILDQLNTADAFL